MFINICRLSFLLKNMSIAIQNYVERKIKKNVFQMIYLMEKLIALLIEDNIMLVPFSYIFFNFF